MGVIPGEPTDVVVTEATKSYVVLAWKPPVQRGHEGVMYYIEKVRRDAIIYRNTLYTVSMKLHRSSSLTAVLLSCVSLTCHSLSVDLSVFQEQTPGRG